MKTTLIAIFLVLFIGAALYFSYGVPSPASVNPSPTAVISSTPIADTSTLYSNSDYGFSFSYPKNFSPLVQNFMDTTGHKTLLTLANADKSETIRVTVLMDAKTGTAISPLVPNYEKAVVADAVYDGSGANPKSFSEFTLRQLGDARFAYLKNGLFEGTLTLSYYAVVPHGIVRFSLTSTGVDWTNPAFDPEQDAGHLALQSMLATFKVGAYSAVASPVSYVPFTDPAGVYSVSVVSGEPANKNFHYDAIGPDKSIPGVSFPFGTAFSLATNLSPDSYISIEKNPYAVSCSASEFISSGIPGDDSQKVTLNGITWDKGSGADTAAGNLYQETVYATKHGNDCYGIRLFLHSGQIANYDAGAVQQFDHAPLDAIQEKVVSSFQFLK